MSAVTKTRPVVETILPPTATALERATDRAAGSILADIPIPLRDLWNPTTCPVAWLPHLAWALSVDYWDDAWPEARKRTVCAQSIATHRRKGTLDAVTQALANMGVRVVVESVAEPYAFGVQIPLFDQPDALHVNDHLMSQILRAVNITRAARSPMRITADDHCTTTRPEHHTHIRATANDPMDFFTRPQRHLSCVGVLSCESTSTH